MLEFLEALNPWSSCFTVTDFDDTLNDITVILKNLDLTSKTSKEKASQLKKAFKLAIYCLNAAGKSQPDKKLTFLIADILTQHAKLSYDHNYSAAKELLVIAFNLHLYTIGIFNECIDIRDFTSLDELYKQCEARPSHHICMEQSILTTSMDRCMTLAYTDSFMQTSGISSLYSLAETAQWLGYCYQNIDQSKAINDENDLRFNQLFGLSENLLLLIDSDISKQSLADLYFQAWPFMLERKSPSNIENICQTYNNALSYDHSFSMQARVAHKRFQTLFSNGKKSEALPLIQQAIALAETLEPSEKNLFLLFSLYDSYAGYWMDPENLDLKKAELYMNKVNDYAAQCLANGDDHWMFATYDMRFAELKIVTGKFITAKEFVNRALITLESNKANHATLIIKAEALKSFITMALEIR